jgi:hypothetical protein
MSRAMKERIGIAGRWLAMIPLALASAAVAQSTHVQFWTSATSGITYKLTIGEHRLEAEKVFPPEYQLQVDHGAYVRCEYSQQGDAWVGKCKSKLPYAGAVNRRKWCTFEFASKITSLTPTRIEGESEVWDGKDVNVEQCELQKTHMQHFVWVLKN